MNKYLPYIFNNGRVVLVKQADIDAAIEQNQEILIFCGAWSGGCAKAIGGEKTTYDGHPCIQMYSYDVQDTEFAAEQMTKFYKVIITSGIRVYMQTGEPASTYTDRFVDLESTYDSFKRRYNYNNQTQEEFLKLRNSVDPKLTLAMMNTEDREEKWKALNGMVSFSRT